MTMNKCANFLAFDLGAESARCIVGALDSKKLKLKEIYRFETKGTFFAGHLYWDILGFLRRIIEALRYYKSKYADDYLTLGSINPYELFLIYNEIVDAQKDINLKRHVESIAFMIDQSHNLKPKIEAMIQSVLNTQIAYAKALLVEREKLVKAQNEGNIIEAEQILINTFQTDVKPFLEKLRLEMGLDPNPIKAYKESKYYNKIRKERG